MQLCQGEGRISEFSAVNSAETYETSQPAWVSWMRAGLRLETEATVVDGVLLDNMLCHRDGPSFSARFGPARLGRLILWATSRRAGRFAVSDMVTKRTDPRVGVLGSALLSASGSNAVANRTWVTVVRPTKKPKVL